MADRALQFEIYRLNIVDEEALTFEFMGRNIRSDEDIKKILERVTNPEFDMLSESGRSTFRWSVREYVETKARDFENVSPVCIISLGRSILQQHGQTVTESGVEEALTTLNPPSAEVIHLMFYLERHLVIAEYNSSIMQSQTWRYALERMSDRAAQFVELLPGLRLEPMPKDDEIIHIFKSFQRLVRLRVKLRIPNPEMDRRTERLRKDMLDGAIREYTQDMKNPSGLSQAEGGLPHATAAMAQAGYKEGEVTMTGFRDGKRQTVRTGKRAARGRVEGLRDFVRGIGSTARTAEGRQMVRSILEEVDKLAELPTPPDTMVE